MKDFTVYRFTKNHPIIASKVHYGFSPKEAICRRRLDGFEKEKMRVDKTPADEPNGCIPCWNYIKKVRK